MFFSLGITIFYKFNCRKLNKFTLSLILSLLLWGVVQMKDNKIKNIMKQVIIFNDIYEEVFHTNLQKSKHDAVSKLEFRLLHTVYRHERLTVSELSELLDISLPNCSRYVKNAIQMGYLNKNIDTLDKRIYYITMSDQGSEIVEDTLSKFSTDISKQLDLLDATALDKLNKSFSNLNNTLSETLLNNKN